MKMDTTLTNLNGYEGFEELAVLARETIDRNTKPLHIEIEQLRTELYKEKAKVVLPDEFFVAGSNKTIIKDQLIQQLQTKLDVVTKIANSRVCDSCGQLHRFDCMCPPVEVRLHGDCWYHKTIKRLQIELKQLKNDIIDVEDDLSWHKAIFDGSWPQAIEILEQTLEKVKAIKGE